MLKVRGLNKRFLSEMRKGLDRGRMNGNTGWDEHWKCNWPGAGVYGPYGHLMVRLGEETIKLTIALALPNHDEIKKRSANIANFAMMIADLEGCLK